MNTLSLLRKLRDLVANGEVGSNLKTFVTTLAELATLFADTFLSDTEPTILQQSTPVKDEQEAVEKLDEAIAQLEAVPDGAQALTLPPLLWKSVLTFLLKLAADKIAERALSK